MLVANRRVLVWPSTAPHHMTALLLMPCRINTVPAQHACRRARCALMAILIWGCNTALAFNPLLATSDCVSAGARRLWLAQPAGSGVWWYSKWSGLMSNVSVARDHDRAPPPEQTFHLMPFEVS